MKHILVGFLFVLAFSFQSAAQMAMMNEKMTDKIVTPEDAAKRALTVGGKMPEFTLSDANGKDRKSVV